jgi:hypothetical protein
MPTSDGFADAWAAGAVAVVRMAGSLGTAALI